MKLITVQCVRCGKWLNSMTNGDLDASHDMWSNGATVVMDVGYGSDFDESRLLIALCDDCIKEQLKEGIIKKMDKTFCKLCGHEM